MHVEQKGHRYVLQHRDGTGTTTIQYVNKEPGQEIEGVTQQEILRMMLDRNRYCTACQPNAVSERIEYHLRMALVLHEMRALERKVQKGELAPEYVEISPTDGHFQIANSRVFRSPDENHLDTYDLKPYTQEWERPCNHHSHE